MLKNYYCSGQDTDKLAMGQELYVTNMHAIEGVLKQPPGPMDQQCPLNPLPGLAFEPTRILFQVPTALNPATLLPNPDWDIPSPQHDCQEILAQVHGV